MGTQFAIGDRVKYRVGFLRSICAYTGPLPFARGTVVAIQPFGDASLVAINWQDDEVPAKVLSCNLTLVSNLETKEY